jgi:serine/threonine protein kinase
MEDLTGKQLGPYKIIERVGKGGMGAVYKARPPRLDRYVALKVLPLHLANDPVFVARFTKEAHAAAQLNHPHIVQIYDYGESDGYHFMAMQLIESRKTLYDLIQGRPLALADIRRVVSQIGDALNYAHACRMVHRDVKPANILFSQTGHYYLTDFGIVKNLDQTEQLTGTGTNIGTAKYMSPEQIGGDELDGRSDIYALGVVMYEMATGRAPFRGKTASVIKKDHLITQPLPPRELNPNLPLAVEQIILRALAKKPDDRYATAMELVDHLRAAIPDESKPVQRIEFDPAKILDQYPPTEPEPVPDPHPAGSKRWRIYVLVGFLLLLCVGTLLGSVSLSNLLPGNTPTPTKQPVVSQNTPVPTATPDTVEPIASVSPDSEASPTASPVQSPDIPMPASPTTDPVSEATATPVLVDETATPLPSTPTPPPVAADLSGYLAIPLLYGNEPKVYVVDSNGNLQNAIGTARQPDYTLTGTKLVVDGHGGGHNKLRVSDPLGNGTYQIGDMGLTEHSHPAWSPDGSQVIYDDATIDPTGTRIFFGDLGTRQGPGTELNAAAGPIIAQYPLWTSRGFVFRGCNTWGNIPSQCGLWLMPGNDGEPAQLTSNPRHIPVDARGDKIAYVSDEAGNWNVYVLDLPTGQSQQLTTSQHADGLPAISPDGRTVAFLSNRENLSVWAVDINGGDPQKLFDIQPDWGQLRADGWAEEKLSWGAN